ncbi:MAG: adenosylhomocysteinase [Deltaproteobacteria bacterium]|nr:adenosylhomocysteinase [Deltaproteobacteria bacterium]
MEIKSKDLAEQGRKKLAWAEQAMPVLRSIGRRFAETAPLKNVRISACLHVTAETGNLLRVLGAGGADIRLCASNPLSTQDDVAAALAVDDDIDVYAVAGEDNETYFRHIRAVLDHRPHVTVDDGADLVSTLHIEHKELLKDVLGGTEETTTGVTRLRTMARQAALKYPIIAVNSAATKHMFDNRHGTGQSSIDGILRATNRMLAGSCFVVCGYGWCGRGVAARARGMGARVIVTEVSPLRALEALMDGHQVLPLMEAAKIGDVFCTVTGNTGVVRREHFERMKDGAIVCNAGHFNVELDLAALRDISTGGGFVRDSLEEYRLSSGRKINVLGQGRLVNLSAAEGHPADVMDMSFAGQALSVEYLVENASSLSAGVHGVPREIDDRIARLKLDGMGVAIDDLTERQRDYLRSWETGT